MATFALLRPRTRIFAFTDDKVLLSFLAIAVAVASSFLDVPVDSELMVFGEVGLAGEVRSVSHAGKRVAEAGKLGFKRCALPRSGTPKEVSNGIKTLPVSRLRDALEVALER